MKKVLVSEICSTTCTSCTQKAILAKRIRLEPTLQLRRAKYMARMPKKVIQLAARCKSSVPVALPPWWPERAAIPSVATFPHGVIQGALPGCKNQ